MFGGRGGAAFATSMGGMGGMGGANINIDPNILFNMMNGGGGFPRSGGGNPFANAHSHGGFEGFEF
jgi:DnaJ family protein C protein 7